MCQSFPVVREETRMRLNQRYSIIVILLMLCGLFANCNAARAQRNSDLKMDATRVPWTHLSFHAKNYWVAVSTDVQMKSRRASDLDAVLLASPKSMPIKPKTPQINELTINTTIDPRLRSPVKIYNRIWFNPTDASVLGRVRLRRGEDDFKKYYRFTEQGVFRHRIEPENKGETRLEPDKWTDIKDTFYPYDTNRLNCPIVTERSVLIYILSAAAFSRNDDPLSLCVFGKRQVHRVRLRKEGTLPIDFDYIEKSRQTENRKKGTVKAFKITMTVQPIESNLEDMENFSFLGFHKDITIYVEPTAGLPIQASGIIPTIGKAHLKLSEVRLKRQSD